MISTESCNAILNIVDRATKTNTVIGASDQSVLGACVVASNTYTVDNFQSETGFIENWQESLTESPVFGAKSPITVKDDNGESTIIIPTSIHAKTMDEASSIIAQAAKNAMQHAQNVATPVIGDFIEAVNDAMSADEEFVERYEIVDITPDEAWGQPVILAALDNYKAFASPKTLKRADIPRINIPADYNPQILTGSKAIDECVARLLSNHGLSAAGAIGLIFNGQDDAGVYPAQYWRDQDTELLKFLISQWLIDNPIPNCGMGGMQWSTITNQLSTAYGSICRIMLGMMERDIKSKKLFYLHDVVSDRIYVNGVVYDQWLSSGGSPELIFGCVMQGDYSAINCQNMIDNSAKILAAWSSAHTAIRNARRSKRESVLREAAFTAALGQIDALAIEYYAPGANKQSMVANARKVIERLSNYELDNLETCAIDIVCDVMFPHTPSKSILRDVNAQLESEVELQDALMCAASNYITDWVVGSLIIGKA